LDDSLFRVPAPAPQEDQELGFATADAGLDGVPGFLRRFVGKILQVGMQTAETAFTAHRLRDTHLVLAGPHLHVRLGNFDAEYGPGEFDPEAAARFVAFYDSLKGTSA
jgi:hypothetical protein